MTSIEGISDLLLLRAVTVIDRGGDGSIWDFKWLLVVATKGDLSTTGDEELGCLCEAVKILSGTLRTVAWAR